MEKTECKIEKGAQDWQIFQIDEKGFAEICLSGTWSLPDNAAGRVLVRVVSEDTQIPPSIETGWCPADTIKDNTWKTVLKVPAGGLYRIETGILPKSGNNKDIIEWISHGDFIHHIGAGDLWVIAGQSNATGYGTGEISDGPEMGVHSLRNEKKWDIASHPLNDSGGHSPFLVFGKLLKKSLGYPIGLIQTAVGGSPLCSWNPIENPSAPLYENMIHCINLTGGKIKGICWYQGCSDATPDSAKTYQKRFIQFVAKTRKDLQSAQLPFITAQLNRYYLKQPNIPQDANNSWSIVTETQRNIPRVLKNVAVIPTTDLRLSDLIHNSPAGNIILGQRFANVALGMVYKKTIYYKFPEIKTAISKNKGKVIILKFENVIYRLHSDLEISDNFIVEDKEGIADIEKAEFLSPSEIILTLKRKIAEEAFVHYGYGINPKTNIYEVITINPLLSFYRFKITQ